MSSEERAEKALYCAYCNDLAIDVIEAYIDDFQYVGLPLCRVHMNATKQLAKQQDHEILIAAIGN